MKNTSLEKAEIALFSFPPAPPPPDHPSPNQNSKNKTFKDIDIGTTRRNIKWKVYNLKNSGEGLNFLFTDWGKKEFLLFKN